MTLNYLMLRFQSWSFEECGVLHSHYTKVLLFSGMPTGSEAFLCSPGVFRLRPWAWTPPKKTLCHTRAVGGTYDKYRVSLARTTGQSVWCVCYEGISVWCVSPETSCAIHTEKAEVHFTQVCRVYRGLLSSVWVSTSITCLAPTLSKMKKV